jgi:hypothetical protein
MSAGDDSTATGRTAVVVVDVSGYRRPDLVLVETLARIRLVTARVGARMAVRGAGSDLARLLELVGLLAIIPLEAPPPLSQMRGNAEAREEPGVEEVMDVSHAPASELEDLDGPGVEPGTGGAGLVVGEGG